MTSIKFKMWCSIIIYIFGISILNAQKKYVAKNNISIAVNGTSTMHDWVMNSSTADISITLQEDDKGNITNISDMQFKMSSKSLKSGKSAMDSNAYKALKAEKNPSITAKLKNAKVSTKDNKIYNVNAKVVLSIAGVERETDLQVSIKKINMDAYEVKSSTKISMKDYDMSPPSFMLGAVKTGNDVTLNINFNIQ